MPAQGPVRLGQQPALFVVAQGLHIHSGRVRDLSTPQYAAAKAGGPLAPPPAGLRPATDPARSNP
jgi:hypothetical protein